MEPECDDCEEDKDQHQEEERDWASDAHAVDRDGLKIDNRVQEPRQRQPEMQETFLPFYNSWKENDQRKVKGTYLYLNKILSNPT